MKKAPHIPLSWYSAKGAVGGAAVAALAFWLGYRFDGPVGILLFLPVGAAGIALALLVSLNWLGGRGQRSYRFGKGRQEIWGYCGQNIRGIVDERGIWISLTDCELATGLDLAAGLKCLASSRQRHDDVRGILLDHTAMLKVLDGCGADAFGRARLRLFLERSVWQTRRG